MKKQISTALISYAVANFKAFGAWGLANHGGVAGVREFGEVYNAKLDRISERGKLGPKGWARLQAACPAQAQQYFAGLYSGGTGPDLTTVEGLANFVSVSQGLARQAGVRPTQQETDLVGSLFDALRVEDEDDDEEDED